MFSVFRLFSPCPFLVCPLDMRLGKPEAIWPRPEGLGGLSRPVLKAWQACILVHMQVACQASIGGCGKHHEFTSGTNKCVKGDA